MKGPKVRPGARPTSVSVSLAEHAPGSGQTRVRAGLIDRVVAAVAAQDCAPVGRASERAGVVAGVTEDGCGVVATDGVAVLTATWSAASGRHHGSTTPTHEHRGAVGGTGIRALDARRGGRWGGVTREGISGGRTATRARARLDEDELSVLARDDRAAVGSAGRRSRMARGRRPRCDGRGSGRGLAARDAERDGPGAEEAEVHWLSLQEAARAAGRLSGCRTTGRTT